eukprot:6025170-Prymnesium_polylepis.1
MMSARCCLVVPLLLAGSSVVAARSECLETRPENLCTVKVSEHKFAPPNAAFPENTRGVYWIDAGDECAAAEVAPQNCAWRESSTLAQILDAYLRSLTPLPFDLRFLHTAQRATQTRGSTSTSCSRSPPEAQSTGNGTCEMRLPGTRAGSTCRPASAT